ncbi:uncharacterized protein LOC129600056 [Paramacrobiotus metropolitanus]|uniref:uncharacterized protein LOC129600056 n=1 Tax=Paramacrobiotus metropolitanus TaxID=2943436 RepID=UPI00244654E3|nr:uncharacterized protein LOC129600056 [Paramacrobiotus metropolitanus]
MDYHAHLPLSPLAMVLLAISGYGLVSYETPGASAYVVGKYNASVYATPDVAYGRLCGLPNVMPAMESLEPEKTHGLWYTYRALTSPFVPHGLNEKLYVHKISRTVVPLTSILAEYQWTVGSHYYPTEPGVCQFWYWVGSVGRDGTERGDVYLSRSSYIPIPTHFVAVLHKDDKYYIEYGCAETNLATGICRVPMAFVRTRIRPSKLSAYDRQEIDRAVNAVFAPYCLTAEDIPLQSFVDATPDCEFPEPPECVPQKIKALSQLPEPVL